jgi:predicted DNA-binding transcriptional regulator AlpA
MISTPVKKIVAKLMHEYANNIDAGNSHLNAEQATNILSCICHIEMTKPEVCEYLNISRSRFDDLVRDKVLPRGKSSAHRNALVWYKDEIICAVEAK